MHDKHNSVKIALILLSIAIAALIIYSFRPFYLYSYQLLRLLVYLSIFMVVFGLQDLKRLEVHKYLFVIGLGLGFILFGWAATVNSVLIFAYLPISLIMIGLIYLLNKQKKALADYLTLWLSFAAQPFIAILAYGVQAGINNLYDKKQKPGIATYGAAWIIVFIIMLMVIR